MQQDAMKQAVADAALEALRARLRPGLVLGIGTGSTTNRFIDGLAGLRGAIGATVASSEASARRLRRLGLPVLDLNAVARVDLYVDGADESTEALALVKGGGGALTREKIIAAGAETFICIADESKLVSRLGAFPLPIEVIPMALRQVSGALAALGGEAVPREGFVTDNGNAILDVHGLSIDDPAELEAELDHITGTVCNGLFARRGADLLLLGGATGVRQLGAG